MRVIKGRGSAQKEPHLSSNVVPLDAFYAAFGCVFTHLCYAQVRFGYLWPGQRQQQLVIGGLVYCPHNNTLFPFALIIPVRIMTGGTNGPISEMLSVQIFGGAAAGMGRGHLRLPVEYGDGSV